MDMYMTLYLAMFAAFLSIDIGLFDGNGNAGTEPEPEPADPENPLYLPDDYARTIDGTEGDDSFTAEEAENLAWFLHGGNDALEAALGSDYANGGAGDDRLMMRGGNDIALGGTGNDTIDAGIGFDRVFGGAGDDRLLGNGGDDSLTGEDGADTVLGGTGNDSVLGGAGDDYLSGMGEGLSGGRDEADIDGIDTLEGGEGDDTLFLGAGDHGTGGAGADRFQLDHSRPDHDDAITVNDFGEGDTLELHYEPELDAEGAPIAPEITVTPSEDGTAGIVSFNGQVVANVAGGQALTAEQIRLVALEG
jgi:serralysin